jgi:ABC-2 type transport system permease protein
MNLPKIGFLRGHGERDNTRQGDRNYNRFAQDKPFRYSLVNQGFDQTDVLLDKEVPQDINIMVIADMRNQLTPVEKANLDKYIARGGNLLIAGEARRQQAMDDLIAPFGVRFTPGILVKPSETSIADFLVVKPTREGGQLIYTYAEMFKRKAVATMPSAVGLEYETNHGFTTTPLFQTDSTCWNEMETTNFIDDTVKLNPAAGEVQKSYTTGLALSRQAGGRTQKIIILGDADCISNGEISISRQGIPASNYSIINGAFYWMSDNEVPIDVRRPSSTDDSIALTKDSMANLKIALSWIIPGIMLILALILWIRRIGR